MQWGHTRRESAAHAWGLESDHTPLALAGGLVGILGTIVEIAVLPMLDTGQELPLGRPIARQFVGDNDPRDVPQALEEFPKELLRSHLIPPALYEDVEHMAVLVDRPPQIMASPVDREEDFIHIPFVARPGPSAPQCIRIRLPELLAPIPYRFIGQRDAAFGHEFFDVPITQAKAKVEPDTMANDLRREPMALVWIGD